MLNFRRLWETKSSLTKHNFICRILTDTFPVVRAWRTPAMSSRTLAIIHKILLNVIVPNWTLNFFHSDTSLETFFLLLAGTEIRFFSSFYFEINLLNPTCLTLFLRKIYRWFPKFEIEILIFWSNKLLVNVIIIHFIYMKIFLINIVETVLSFTIR